MHTPRRKFILGTLGATAAGVLAPVQRVLAAAYPERPITFVCPWPAGGTADHSMRALCSVASRNLGQSIVVENKAGASGMLGIEGDGERQSPTATPSARSRSR